MREVRGEAARREAEGRARKSCAGWRGPEGARTIGGGWRGREARKSRGIGPFAARKPTGERWNDDTCRTWISAFEFTRTMSSVPLWSISYIMGEA